jgi:hypothetical protein
MWAKIRKLKHVNGNGRHADAKLRGFDANPAFARVEGPMGLGGLEAVRMWSLR